MDRNASLPRKSHRMNILVPIFVTLLALQPGYSEPKEASEETAKSLPANAPTTEAPLVEAQPAELPPAMAVAAEPLRYEAPIAPIMVKNFYRPFSKIAIGFNFGASGAGVEVATPLTRRTNLRVDGGFFNYSPTIADSGFSFASKIRLRSVRVSYDFFPFHGSFHVSGGVAVYNRLNMTAVGTTPAGGMVSMNDVNYYSSQANPLNGTATVVYGNKVAPTIAIGWGNAIRRSGHHFAFPVEIGVAFTGTPVFALSMQGSACTTRNDPRTCSTPANADSFNSNVAAEQIKINNELKPAHFYPILDAGVTYRF